MVKRFIYFAFWEDKNFFLLDSISRANEGVYKCNASSDFGVAEDSVKVQGKEIIFKSIYVCKLYFLVVPRGKRQVVILDGSERVVASGARLELRCLLMDVDSKLKLRWVKKSPTGSSLPIQNYQPHEGVLIVPDLTGDDAGIYECQAWDSEGDRVVSSDEVKVTSNGDHDLVTVVTVDGGPMKYLTVGDLLELKCTAPGKYRIS